MEIKKIVNNIINLCIVKYSVINVMHFNFVDNLSKIIFTPTFLLCEINEDINKNDITLLLSEIIHIKLLNILFF